MDAVSRYRDKHLNIFIYETCTDSGNENETFISGQQHIDFNGIYTYNYMCNNFRTKLDFIVLISLALYFVTYPG